MQRKRKMGKWLLNVRWNIRLRKIAANIGRDKQGKLKLKGADWWPWTLRAMLAVPSKEMQKDMEDGWGVLLVIWLMTTHRTDARGRPLRRTRHKGWHWSDMNARSGLSCCTARRGISARW